MTELNKNFLNSYFGSKFFSKRIEQLQRNIQELEEDLKVEYTEEKFTKLETLKRAEHMLSRLVEKSK